MKPSPETINPPQPEVNKNDFVRFRDGRLGPTESLRVLKELDNGQVIVGQTRRNISRPIVYDPNKQSLVKAQRGPLDRYAISKDNLELS